MRNLIISLLMMLATNVMGQDYNSKLKEGDSFIADNQYENAIDAYLKAQIYEPVNFPIIRERINEVYYKIDTLRILAENREKEIIAQNEQLRIEKANTERARQRAVVLQKRAEKAEVIAKKEASIAKANLLSYKARALMEKDSNQVAFNSAFLAMHILDSIYVPIVTETFGATVYQAKKQTISKNEVQLQNTLFSASGKYMLINKANKKAVLADTLGKKIVTITHKKTILSTAFSPSEDKILTCSADGTAKIYDIDRDTLIHFKKHSDEVLGGSFSKNGNLIATWSRDDTTLLWKPTGELINSLGEHKGNVYDVVFSPNEEKIITRSSDQTVKLWDTTGLFIKTLEGHDSYIYHTTFSPSGKNIITCAADNKVILWDGEGNFVTALQHQAIATEAIFSKDSRKIMTISLDNHVTVWQQKKGLWVPTFIKHNSPIKEAWFSKDGKRILSIEEGTHINIWDSSTGKRIKKLEKHKGILASAKFSKNERYILSHDEKGKANLWDANDGTLQMQLDHTGKMSPQFTPNQKYIITSSDGKKIEQTPLPKDVYVQTKQTFFLTN